MEIYNAILQAADTIEREPHRYDFFENVVPGPGGNGCMLGFIGFHLGIEAGLDVYVAVTPVVGVRYASFEILGLSDLDHTVAADVVTGLRHFAQRYKPAPLPFVDLLASVRKLFDREFAVSQS